MIAEDLMRKYKYGYVHSCKLLEEPFIKTLLKENQESKERLERINNYLDKHYSMENQYWFDHIRDIVKDR